MRIRIYKKFAILLVFIAIIFSSSLSLPFPVKAAGTPVLTLVNPVSNPSRFLSNGLTYNSDQAGTAAFGGGCGSAQTEAVAGDNNIILSVPADGTYFCTITVTTNGNNSAVLFLTPFTIDTVGPNYPTLSLPAGTYNGAIRVSNIRQDNDVNKVYYTLDGADPDTFSNYWNGYVDLSGPDGSAKILKMRAYDPLENAGPVGTFQYSFDSSISNAPLINPAGGTFGNSQSVSMSSNTGSALIYYTLDGSAPSSSSQPYNSPFFINGDHGQTKIVKAISYDSGGNPSQVSSASFSFDKIGPTAPTASLSSGTYNAAISLALNVAGDSVSTYYTVNGSQPDNSSYLFTGMIYLDALSGQSIILKAVSYDQYGNQGGIMTNIFTFIKPSGGASAPSSYCSSVNYDAWQSCINGTQYRNVLSVVPTGCVLNSDQQATTQRLCSVQSGDGSIGSGNVSTTTPFTQPTPVVPVPQVLGTKIFQNGSLIRSSNKRIYIVFDDIRYYLNLAEFRKLGARKINQVDDATLAKYKEVKKLKLYFDGDLIRSPKGKTYVIVKGKKQYIATLTQLRKYKKKKIEKVTEQVIGWY